MQEEVLFFSDDRIDFTATLGEVLYIEAAAAKKESLWEMEVV